MYLFDRHQSTNLFCVQVRSCVPSIYKAKHLDMEWGLLVPALSPHTTCPDLLMSKGQLCKIELLFADTLLYIYNLLSGVVRIWHYNEKSPSWLFHISLYFELCMSRGIWQAVFLSFAFFSLSILLLLPSLYPAHHPWLLPEMRAQ